MTDQETNMNEPTENEEVKPRLGEESPPVGDLPPEKQDNPSVTLIIFLIIPLIGILAALLMIVSNSANNGGDTPTGTLINYTAPSFELSRLDGQATFTPEDFAGDVVFINFWQTTCEPCIRELPAFAEFAQDQEGQGVHVLAINFEETSQQVQSFLDEVGITTLDVALDPDGTARRSYGIQAIPTTYIIAPDGTVSFLHLGELTYAEMEDYVDLVRIVQDAS